MSTLTTEKDGTAVASEAATGFSFLPPGNINDFPDDLARYHELLEAWNQHLTGFTEQARIGNTWQNLNTPPTPNYYNPAYTTPTNPGVQHISWSPFPGRFTTYYGPNSTTPLNSDQQLELADTGFYHEGTQKKTFPQITAEPCTYFQPQNFPANGSCGCSGTPTNMIPYGPYGPRGWQDEYCEWCVTRNGNDITRIDFTCENPEYWNTLWQVSPEKVLELYRKTLNNPNIRMQDLQLTSGFSPVIDPGTGKPAYNPLNFYNYGPAVLAANFGGAMHLTSTPNTLQTEIGLGAGSTIPRTPQSPGPNNIQTLLCSGQYGQYGRNSDPNIGAGINAIAAAGNSVTLYNPPGLYMQLPANLNAEFNIPGVQDITPYFKVTRGGEPVTVNGVTYHLNLHITVEAPAGMPALSRMTVANSGPLKWAAQIAQKMTMIILASAYATSKQTPLACSTPATSHLHAQPYQLFHADVFNAMLKSPPIENPVGFKMSLLSNSTFLPAIARRGNSYKMVLTYQPVSFDTVKPGDPRTWPQVIFDDPAIDAVVNYVGPPFTYAVPGNSYPGQVLGIEMTVTIATTTKPGSHSVIVKDNGETGFPGPAMPALLNVK